ANGPVTRSLTPLTVVPSCFAPFDVVASGLALAHCPVVAVSVPFALATHPKLVSKLSKKTTVTPPPAQSAGISVAALWVVPLLPVADAPIPWRAKTVHILHLFAPAFRLWSACRMPSRASRKEGPQGVNFMPFSTRLSESAAPSSVRRSHRAAAQTSPSRWTSKPPAPTSAYES